MTLDNESWLSPLNWTWVREQQSAWTIDGKALSIASLPGSLWGDSNNAKNIALYSIVKLSDLSNIEVTVENIPLLNGEQGGLLLYGDDDNYIKFVKELVDDKHVIVLAKEINGKVEVLSLQAITSDPLTLQWSISDTTITARFKDANGNSWTDSASFSAKEFMHARVGFCVHGGEEENVRWSRFTNLIVS